MLLARKTTETVLAMAAALRGAKEFIDTMGLTLNYCDRDLLT